MTTLHLSKQAYAALFIVAILAKVIAGLLFTSDYEIRLFTPFLLNALKNPLSPWDAATQLPADFFPVSPFPYPTVMYIVYLPVAAILKLISVNAPLLKNIVFKIPTLIADVSIFLMLRSLFPKRRGITLLIYFCSPVIFYSCYMHSQLDLIPTGLLMSAIFLLARNRLLWSAIFLALAICAKFHVAATLPLILIYLFKNYRKIYTAYFLVLTGFVCAVFLMPYRNSPGFAQFVLDNEQQRKLLDSFYQIGDLKIYLPLFAVSILYLRFYLYRKINIDLFFSYLTILFLAFIMLISPGPGWFVWIVPFISLLFIRRGKEDSLTMLLHFAVSATAVIFSVFFFKSEIVDLRFIDVPIYWKIENPLWRNYGFTIAEAVFFCLLIYIYRYGVKSNSIYKMNQAIVVGIAGDSSTGKSTLLSDIKKLISGDQLVLLEGDGDHKWERGSGNWKILTHLNPKANFLHRQAEHITNLKNHKQIERTDYDHNTGRFTAPQRVLSNDIIVLSGLHAFYLPISRKAIDLKIYLHVEENLRRHWKICRDVKYRNHDKAYTLQQIESRMDDARKYIYPQRQFADIVIEYFTDTVFDMGNPETKLKINLKIWLNANLNLEPILRYLDTEQMAYSHDFDENLRNQYLVLTEEADFSDLLESSDDMIPNIDELVGKKIVWEKGFRGLVQLIIAMNLSHLFADRNFNNAA